MQNKYLYKNKQQPLNNMFKIRNRHMQNETRLSRQWQRHYNLVYHDNDKDTKTLQTRISRQWQSITNSCMRTKTKTLQTRQSRKWQRHCKLVYHDNDKDMQHNTITNSEIHIEGYNIGRLDRFRNGGEVCVFIREDIAIPPWQDLHDDRLEALWIELFIPKHQADYYWNRLHTIKSGVLSYQLWRTTK